MATRAEAVHTTTCPLCEACCGLLIEVDAGAADGSALRSIRGDPDDPLSRGYVCPKAMALADLHADPDRVRTPRVREGTRWRDVGWDEALARAAEGLRRVRRRHGRDAVAVYYGNPVAHNLGLMTHALPFGRALRSRNVYSASSADQLPQMLASFLVFGHLALIPVPDLDRTDFLIVAGANPAASNGSLMTAPGVAARLRAIRARGGRVVVIDPRRTETAAMASEHLAIRPGTDALLFAAMLQVVFAENLVRSGRLDGATTGSDRLAQLVRDLPPERVAARVGVAAPAIRELARTFARADRSACYGRVGLCTQEDGTVAAWLGLMLNLLTGHLDEVGGMMFPTPAVDAVGVMARLGMRGSFDRWRSRVRQLPEFGGEVPVATLADEIEQGGRGQVRALVTIAGNPALSAPNGRRLDRALGTLEHMVAIDPYLNETTRHAHVLLPPAPILARAHYDLALYVFAVRNVARFSAPVLPRRPDERHDWEILAALTAGVFAPRPLRRPAAAALQALRPERLLDLLLRAGPHGLSLAALRAKPHGIDLGPLQPGRLRSRIATPDRLVDLAPELLLAAARRRLAAEADRPDDGRLELIGRRQLRGNNSWMHNAPSLARGGRRCTLFMHPVDAAARVLGDGDVVRLTTGAGAIVVPVEITDTVRPGVVCLPHGWGHDRDGTRLTVARADAGASVNDVTSDRRLDALSGNAAFSGTPVEVERVAPGPRPGAGAQAPPASVSFSVESR